MAANRHIKKEHTGKSTAHTGSLSTSRQPNQFANDGSFLEMFKKKMEEKNTGGEDKTDARQSHSQQTLSSSSTGSSSSAQSSISDCTKTNNIDSRDNASGVDNSKTIDKPKKLFPFVGKRRGTAPVLKTGAVKKAKQDETKQNDSQKKDAWAQYMDEVNRYKARSCQDEDKTRPLVK